MHASYLPMEATIDYPCALEHEIRVIGYVDCKWYNESWIEDVKLQNCLLCCVGWHGTWLTVHGQSYLKFSNIMFIWIDTYCLCSMPYYSWSKLFKVF